MMELIAQTHQKIRVRLYILKKK